MIDLVLRDPILMAMMIIVGAGWAVTAAASVPHLRPAPEHARGRISMGWNR